MERYYLIKQGYIDSETTWDEMDAIAALDFGGLFEKCAYVEDWNYSTDENEIKSKFSTLRTQFKDLDDGPKLHIQIMVYWLEYADAENRHVVSVAPWDEKSLETLIREGLLPPVDPPKIWYGVYYLWNDAINHGMITKSEAERDIKWAVDFANRGANYGFLRRIRYITAEEFCKQWNWLARHKPEDYDSILLSES